MARTLATEQRLGYGSPMRAIVFDTPGDPNVLRVADIPSPTLGPQEVRIAVRTCALNRADLLQRRGLYPPPRGASPILGLECAGEVQEIGADTSGLEVGQRVMALLTGGGYAEEVVCDARTVVPVPESFSDVEAGAFMETFLTAFSNLFWLADARRGRPVLVHGGSSGVGTAAIALCKEAGVPILVTAGSDARCARCTKLGATLAINYRTQSFEDGVLAHTAGAGVAVVLDSIGAAYLSQNLVCLADEGRLVLIGLLGGARCEVDLAVLLRRRLQIMGSTLRSRSSEAKAEIIATLLARFGEALQAGRLRPVVHATLPLAQAAQAHRLMQAGEHFGKIVLQVR